MVTGLSDQTVGFMKINARGLREPFSNQSSFISKNGTVNSLFEFKDPFITNKMLMWIRRNQLPSIVSSEDSKLFRHGPMPYIHRDIITKSLGLGLSPSNLGSDVR